MMSRQFIARGLVLAAALIVVGYLLFLPASPLENSGSAAPKPIVGHPAAAKIVGTAPLSASEVEKAPLAGFEPVQTAIDTPEARDDTFIRINEAMATYSEEGLPVLKPYLAHSDPEIRDVAVEAIVQLAVPTGAEVLRNAARKAPTPEERIRMLQAAEFLELPRLPLEQLKKLIERGEVQLPDQVSP